MQKCKVSEIKPWGQIFAKLALSHTISETNEFLNFTQIFKIAAKKDGKTIFGKSRQMTLQDLPWGSQI